MNETAVTVVVVGWRLPSGVTSPIEAIAEIVRRTTSSLSEAHRDFTAFVAQARPGTDTAVFRVAAPWRVTARSHADALELVERLDRCGVVAAVGS